MTTENKIFARKSLIALAAASVLMAIGVAGGWWWATSRHSEQMPMVTGDESSGESNVLYWYDPMYPQQHFDQPGQSPFMDMALVPKYASENNDAAAVQIDPRVSQNLGLRLAMAEYLPLETLIETTAIVAFNDRDVAIEQVRVGGFVERVWPLAPGDVITVGQALVELRVPEWTAAQREWLVVRGSGDAELLTAARDRLRQLGMSDAHLRELEQRANEDPVNAASESFVLKASRNGVIQELVVRAGMTLMPGQTLARINGLATVWLDVALPEAQTEGVAPGQRVEAKLPAFPGQVFAGRIKTILPALNEASRSLRIRVELSNDDGRLRPGMTAQLRLHAGGEGKALVVPTEAIIRTGKRALVIVAENESRFTPVEVTLGHELAEHTVITSGLQDGQKIVASGQFLIDSEASLSGVLARSVPAMSDTMTVPALHEADARVEAIDGEAITLAHGPFKSLGMPGMTMTFTLADPALVNAIQVGDRVHVGVRETDRGLMVETIQKATSAAPSGDQP